MIENDRNEWISREGEREKRKKKENEPSREKERRGAHRSDKMLRKRGQCASSNAVDHNETVCRT